MILEYFISLLSSQSFIDTIIIGVIGGLFLKFSSYLLSLSTEYFYSHKNFTLSGVWISIFDSYALDKGNIEIGYIMQKKESVNFMIQQYNNTNKDISKYKGNGIFRSGELSAIYYPNNKNMIQNGTLLMRISYSLNNKPQLIGFYQEFDHTTDIDKVNIGNGSYILQRINLPFWKTLKMRFNINCFQNYQEVKPYLMAQE